MEGSIKPFMDNLWVKVCGLMQPEQAVAIAHMGANAIGFICARSSPRYVTPLQIRAMSQALIEASTSAERVGVFADADLATLDEAVTIGQLTMIQLHGQESAAACGEIRQAYPNLKLVKAFRIRSQADLELTQSYESSVDALLLDAYHPHLLGGTGETLNWSSLTAFRPGKPWILAGGLTPTNVGQALAKLAPDGIDLSSSIEVSPGNKSLAKAQSLFDAINRDPPL